MSKSSSQSLKTLAGKTIMLVQRDESARLAVRSELAALDASVIEAEDCKDALDQALIAAPDAVLADLRLLGANALELFASLQLACRQTPVFFLVAGAGEDGGDDITETEARSFGAVAVFHPPVNASRIASEILGCVGAPAPDAAVSDELSESTSTAG